MRIQFEKGKQREFLDLVVEKTLAPSLRELLHFGLSTSYSTLKNYYTEARTLPEELFLELCELGKIDPKMVQHEKLSEHWGRIKGGKVRKRGYRNSFESFLKLTNEKKVFKEYILKTIKDIKAKSLLDIGAGNGDLAFPISKAVKRYVAVERSKEFISSLRKQGLEVVPKEFLKGKLDLSEQFDLVLCSYVINHDRYFQNFVKKALRYVKPKGHLLIITHQSANTEFGRFCDKIGYKNFWDKPWFFGEIMKFLLEIGVVKRDTMKTRITSKDPREMESALAFVAAAGIKYREDLFFEKKEKILDVLKGDYRLDDGYSFPFEHEAILVQKR